MANTFDPSKYDIADEVVKFTITFKEDSFEENSLHHTKTPNRWRQVTKEKFYDFIKSYPTKLEFDTTGICDPPLSSYNDFSRGYWPESMVAKVHRNDMVPKEWNAGENEYYLLNELCPET